VQDGVLTLRGRAGWAHDFNPDRSIAATFQTLPGASFVVNGAAQAHDSALVTGAAQMKWLNGWSTAATFEGEFSNVTRSYAGEGVARYAWCVARDRRALAAAPGTSQPDAATTGLIFAGALSAFFDQER
jgi:hypothetical protein